MYLRRITSILTLSIVLAGGFGCASTQVRLPWDRDRVVGTCPAPDAETEKESDDQSQPESADEPGVREASYWAQRAVDASRQYAWARGHRAAQGDAANRALAARSDSSENEAKDSAGPNYDKIDRKSEETPEEADESGSESPRETASSTPTRTVSRKSKPGAVDDSESVQWPLTIPEKSGRRIDSLVDPTAETKRLSLSDEDVRTRVREKYGIDDLPSSEGAIAIPGTFSTELDSLDRLELSEEATQKQLAVVRPGRSLAFYAGSREIARAEFGDVVEMPDEFEEVRPVRVVEDGTLQLVFYWNETTSDSDEIRYKAGLMKLIGAQVGRAFERTVAVRPKKGADLQKRGYFAFLRGDDHNRVQWIPADQNGAPERTNATVLNWNRWEGVFRPPMPPPTAPDQRG